MKITINYYTRMKKYLLIAATACLALAACTKNEVKPVSTDQEITFETISTKATEVYSKLNIFKTWAYMHTADYAASIDKQLYLGGTDGLVISYVPASSQWKNATSTYYWPKNGDKLTFFSYATNSNTCSLSGATVKCDFENGIIVEGFATDSNHDVDFLVADVAKNMTANADPVTYHYVGVPTLFRHKLSNVIFTINSKENYDKKTFKLQSIDLVNVTATANYIQNPLNPTYEGWNGISLHNVTYCNTETLFDKTVLIPTALQSYYIPQTFDNSTKVILKYTITTNNGESDPSNYAVENVVVEKKLSELFGASWKMGTRYTCAITVSLDEILWDPAVEPWVDEYHTLPI